jgi:hypothetical protein
LYEQKEKIPQKNILKKKSLTTVVDPELSIFSESGSDLGKVPQTDPNPDLYLDHKQNI